MWVEGHRNRGATGLWRTRGRNVWVRAGDNVYALTMTRVTNAALRQLVFEALMAKYDKGIRKLFGGIEPTVDHFENFYLPPEAARLTLARSSASRKCAEADRTVNRTLKGECYATSYPRGVA